MRIAIFDSGVGGLSVLKEIERRLPEATLHYFCDKAHFPYGNKSPEEIIACTLDCAKLIALQKIDLLVVACHTASAYALETLKKEMPFPVIGMCAPTLELVEKTGPHKRLVLFATEATLKSGLYQKNISAKTLALSGGPLASLIEQEAYAQISSHLKDLLSPLEEGDTLLLACTHYPAIQSQIACHLPPSVKILNPAQQVAEAVTHFNQKLLPTQGRQL